MLEPFRSSNISWESFLSIVTSEPKHYFFLVIDHKTKKSNIYSMSSEDGSWFNADYHRQVEKLFLNNTLRQSLIIPINRWDWSFLPMKSNAYPSPILSFCQKQDDVDVLWPCGQYHNTFSLSDYTLNKTEWLKKKNIAWFRGTTTGRYKGRITILNESRSISHMVDAKLFKELWNDPRLIALCEKNDLYGEKMSLHDGVKTFRYIIDIDGHCAAMRLQELLGRNVVVIKVRSQEKQWFSSAIKPYIHYIPIDLEPFQLSHEELVQKGYNNMTLGQKSNIKEIMEWIMKNEDRVYEIVKAANRFYFDYLSKEAVNCYILALIRELNILYSFNVADMIDEVKRIATPKTKRRRVLR
eukprot:gene8364-17231_t